MKAQEKSKGGALNKKIKQSQSTAEGTGAWNNQMLFNDQKSDSIPSDYENQ